MLRQGLQLYFRKLADQEDGRLMSQNNLLVWMPDSFMGQRGGGVEEELRGGRVDYLGKSPGIANLRGYGFNSGQGTKIPCASEQLSLHTTTTDPTYHN